ncbi:MAG TPA: hypothetical protein VIG72_09395 [Pontibacter sp.]
MKRNNSDNQSQQGSDSRNMSNSPQNTAAGNNKSSGQGRGWHGDPQGHARAGSQSHKNSNKSGSK